MLATLVDAPFHRPGWVWEEKYDGIRLDRAARTGARVRLLTRNDKDRTGDFPDVAAAVAALPAPTLVLDGEVVVFDAGGVSRFQLLQRRAAGASAPVYVVFDCLHARGRDLTQRAADGSPRRAGGGGASRGRCCGSPAAWPTTACRRSPRRDGADWKGSSARTRRSPYLAGERSRAWSKVKVRAEEEFVVGGFTAPRGARQHLGALLVGAWDGGALRYAGKVGTGFTEATLADLHRRLAPPAASPVTVRRSAARARDVVGRAGAGRPARLHRAHRRRQAAPSRPSSACATTRTRVRFGGRARRGRRALHRVAVAQAARGPAGATRRAAARPRSTRRSRRRAPGP